MEQFLTGVEQSRLFLTYVAHPVELNPTGQYHQLLIKQVQDLNTSVVHQALF